MPRAQYQRSPVSCFENELTFATKTHDETEPQLVHTCAFVFIASSDLLSLDRGGGSHSPLSSRAGPAHQSLAAGPSSLPVTVLTWTCASVMGLPARGGAVPSIIMESSLSHGRVPPESDRLR